MSEGETRKMRSDHADKCCRVLLACLQPSGTVRGWLQEENYVSKNTLSYMAVGHNTWQFTTAQVYLYKQWTDVSSKDHVASVLILLICCYLNSRNLVFFYCLVAEALA